MVGSCHPSHACRHFSYTRQLAMNRAEVRPTLGVLLVSGILCLSACVANKSAAPPTTQWTRDDVVGLTIELIDPNIIESMSFTAQGIAVVTIGRKDGWVAAPAWPWRLIRGRLQLNHRDEVYEELTLISRDASIIVARRRNGKIARYRILKP